MQDKTYPLEVSCSIHRGINLNITKAEARRLRDQLDAIEQTPEARVWRDGDVIKACSPAIYLKGSIYWLNGDGKSTLDTSFFKMYNPLGNLFDIIQQGPILVGLTEDEASHLAELCISMFCNHREPIREKIAAALATYRSRKEGT